MNAIKSTSLEVHINFKVRISIWDAIKLRIVPKEARKEIIDLFNNLNKQASASSNNANH